MSALETEAAAREEPERENRGLRAVLGPGLVTGAADDDPSGIATYSQAGAQFGYAAGWTLLLTYPLMVAVQVISARVGRTTGRGLAGNIARCYPRWVVFVIVGPLLLANVINLGADLGAMGDAIRLLIGGPVLLYVTAFGAFSAGAQVRLQYSRYVSLLKWLTLALFSYIATLFVIKVDWIELLRDLIWPKLNLNADYLSVVVAVFGTTISPYLFFWQAAQEVEDLKAAPSAQPLVKAPEQAARANERIQWDTMIGMGLSNLIGLAIMITTAATLHVRGITDIHSSVDAAKALEPIAGSFARFAFATGIVGTGLLAVPVLAGSAAYAVGEARRWPVGLSRAPHRARAFYGVLVAATAVGVALNFTAVNPIDALFWSAVINGIVAVPTMIVLMILASNARVMKQFVIGRSLSVLGWLATAAMALAAIGMVAISLI